MTPHTITTNHDRPLSITVYKTKLSIGLSMLIFTAVVFYSHYTGIFFPALPIGMVVSVSTILISIFSSPVINRQTAFVLLIVLILLSTLYKVYLFLYPASLIGYDTGMYAHQIQLLLDANHVRGVDETVITFYPKAPLFLLLNALAALIGGTTSETAMVIYPIILSIVYPVSAFILAERIAPTKPLRTAVTAAAVATLGTLSLQYGFHPIAETLAIALWLVFLHVAVRYYSRRRNTDFLLMTLLLIALLYTHKLPGIVVGGIFTLLFAIDYMEKIFDNTNCSKQDRPVHPILLLVVTMVIVQWTFLTEYIKRAVFRGVAVLSPTFLTTFFGRILAIFGGSKSRGVVPPDAILNPLLIFLMRNLYAIILFPLAAVGWIRLLFSHRRANSATRVILAGSAFIMILVVFGYVRRVLANPRRFTFFAEVMLIVLAIVAVVWLLDFNNLRLPRVSIALVGSLLIILLTAQAFSTPAFPNHPVSSRDYLTKTEIQGKKFTQNYISGNVHTDAFYAAKPPANPAQLGQSAKYTSMGEELLRQSNNITRHEYVLYRENVKIYRTAGNSWRLNWNSRQLLNNSYSRVYSNDGTTVYTRTGK